MGLSVERLLAQRAACSAAVDAMKKSVWELSYIADKCKHNGDLDGEAYARNVLKYARLILCDTETDLNILNKEIQAHHARNN